MLRQTVVGKPGEAQAAKKAIVAEVPVEEPTAGLPSDSPASKAAAEDQVCDPSPLPGPPSPHPALQLALVCILIFITESSASSHGSGQEPNSGSLINFQPANAAQSAGLLPVHRICTSL